MVCRIRKGGRRPLCWAPRGRPRAPPARSEPRSTRHRDRVLGARPRQGARALRPRRDPSRDRRAGLRDAGAHPCRRGGRARRGRDTLLPECRDSRAAGGGGCLPVAHARRRHLPRAAAGCQRREAVPVLHRARRLQPRRRGGLPGPRLSDLRVGDPLERGDPGTAAAARGARLRLRSGRSGSPPDGTHEARDPELPAKPHRRGDRRRRLGRGRQADRPHGGVGALRRGLRAALVRGRVPLDRERARAARSHRPARRLLEDLRDDRLAVRLRGGAGAARRPARALLRQLHLVRAAIRAARRDRRAHGAAGRTGGDARGASPPP